MTRTISALHPGQPLAAQIREILSSGLKGYQSKWGAGEEKHRGGRSTEAARGIKKLIGKSMWFKTGRKRLDKLERAKENSTKTNNSKPKPSRDTNTDQVPNPQSNAVIFVPRTHNGALATSLKEKEEELNRVIRRRVKVVEKTGTQPQHILTKSDPWGSPSCEREDCLVCPSNKDNTNTSKCRNGKKCLQQST